MKKLSLAAVLLLVLGLSYSQKSSFGPASKTWSFTVPMDYDHKTWIDTFVSREKKIESEIFIHDSFVSKSFSKERDVFKKGKSYTVKFFPMTSKASGKDCVDFLKKKHAILVGAHGLTLMYYLTKDSMPMVYSEIISFDSKKRLWQVGGEYAVPTVYTHDFHSWKFNFTYLDWQFYPTKVLVAFFEK